MVQRLEWHGWWGGTLFIIVCVPLHNYCASLALGYILVGQDNVVGMGIEGLSLCKHVEGMSLCTHVKIV